MRVFLPGIVVTLATPLWKVSALASAGTASVSRAFQNSSVLAGELDTLKVQNNTLANENVALTQQVQGLQQLTGTSTALSGSITAGVLVRPPTSPYDTLIAGAGSVVGVKKGAYVYGAGDVPLGQVESVNNNSSRVVLFSTAGRATDGWLGQTHTPVTLMGLGAGAYSAQLPKGSLVSVGDFVYVSGPGALPIGNVARIDIDPSSPLMTVHIVPALNLFSIIWVLIAPDAPIS